MKYSMIVVAALGAAACAGAPAPVAAPPAPVPVVAPAPPPPVVQPTPPVPTPPPTPAFDPEGSYELQITFGGQQLPLAVELWRENGKWHGTATITNLGGADLSDLAQDGRKLKLTVVSSAGPSYVINLQVDSDNSVAGDWSGGGDGSRISGKKIK